MAKQVKDVESFKHTGDEKNRTTVIITADDDVRYIFDVTVEEVKLLEHDEYTVKFSHRYYPEREKGKKRDGTNHRLPHNIAMYMRDTYGEVEYMDGMTKEAQLNKQTVQNLNNGPATKVC